MRVFLVAGARPNFMKIAPLYKYSKSLQSVECNIVHTGQHYDYEMSQAFFDDLNLPKPHFFLNAGSGTHAQQTAKVMIEFENLCRSERPDLVMVVGDVNSTLAASIVAKKSKIVVAHVEAGLRSFDMEMPEEINRLVTDSITDIFFVTEESAYTNLVKEGKSSEKIHFVGNVMIDNLLNQIKAIEKKPPTDFDTYEIKQKSKNYAFMTLHRPSNVDEYKIFHGICEAINEIAEELDVFFAVHPRTKKMMDEFEICFSNKVTLLPPLRYNEALFLWKDAKVVLTDSGGLQEETTALKIPCVTLRNNTERPITIVKGTNFLAGNQKDGIMAAFQKASSTDCHLRDVPEKWDGKASQRIWDVVVNSLIALR